MEGMNLGYDVNPAVPEATRKVGGYLQQTVKHKPAESFDKIITVIFNTDHEAAAGLRFENVTGACVLSTRSPSARDGMLSALETTISAAKIYA